jgi:hypothetical protein
MAEMHHEITVEGPALLIKGYIAGFLSGRGLSPDAVLVAEELPIHVEGVIERVAEWMHLQRRDSHLLVPQTLYGDVKHALEQAGPIGLRVQSDRPVASASLDFTYTAYTRRHAAELDAWVKSRADRLRVSEDYQPKEVADSSLEGIEGYAPAHEFEATARGTLTGDLLAILAEHDSAKRLSLLTVSAVRLNYSTP